jgi:hypothetical protein
VDEWVAELKAQLEYHNTVVVLLEDVGRLMITSVSYDSEHDSIVIEVAPPE